MNCKSPKKPSATVRNKPEKDLEDRIRERAPDIADQLRHTADGLDREAAELSREFGISLPVSGD